MFERKKRRAVQGAVLGIQPILRYCEKQWDTRFWSDAFALGFLTNLIFYHSSLATKLAGPEMGQVLMDVISHIAPLQRETAEAIVVLMEEGNPNYKLGMANADKYICVAHGLPGYEDDADVLKAKAVAEQYPPGSGATTSAVLLKMLFKDVVQKRLTLESLEAVTTLEELEVLVRQFEGCALKRFAKNTCFARGSTNARIMLIGEAPGRDEDRQGKPFVGRAGQLLDRMLASIGLDETLVYMTYTIYWRPPGNRTPTPQEIESCAPFLSRQIELLAPDVIVLIGGAAAKTVLNVTENIFQLRGKWRIYKSAAHDIPTLATLHPAFLLRKPQEKRHAWHDLMMLKERLEALKTVESPGVHQKLPKSGADSFEMQYKRLDLARLSDADIVVITSQMVSQNVPNASVMCVVAYLNLIPLTTFQPLDEVIELLATDLDSQNEEEHEISTRRGQWFFLSALIMKATKLAVKNRELRPQAVEMWLKLAEDCRFIKPALEHNVLWAEDEKSYFATLTDELDSQSFLLNHVMPKWLRDSNEIAQYAKERGILFYG